MKKILACILACLMTTAFFAGCSDKDGNGGFLDYLKPGTSSESSKDSSSGGITAKPPAENDENWTGFY